jgi:hypothetical protein
LRAVEGDERRTRRPRPSLAWYVPLLAPFVGTLWVPFYDSAEPRAFGVPYFYWYQFLWIVISAAITAVVYFGTRERAR